MNILITGGAGFIGSHLTDALIKEGHRVMILDDFSNGNKKFVNPKAKISRVDLHDYEKVEKVFKLFKPAAVFHLAAKIDIRTSFEDKKLYATDSMNIWRLCQLFGAKRLIFSSSAAVYGVNNKLPLKEHFKKTPTSQYGFSKSNFEIHLNSKNRSDNIKAVVLRYANVYGPRQGTVGEGGVIAIFCKKLLQKKPLIIFGNGRQTRDFIFVEDVVRSNIAALSSSKKYAVYNVSTTKEASINDIAEKLLFLSRADVRVNHKKAIKGEVSRSKLDNRLIKKELAWSPLVHLDEGLKRTWEWFRERYERWESPTPPDLPSASSARWARGDRIINNKIL